MLVQEMLLPTVEPPLLVVSRVVAPARVDVPKVIPAPAVLMTPFSVELLAVLMTPLVKVKLGELPLARVTPPVLRNVVAGVRVPPLLKATEYP